MPDQLCCTRSKSTRAPASPLPGPREAGASHAFGTRGPRLRLDLGAHIPRGRKGRISLGSKRRSQLKLGAAEMVGRVHVQSAAELEAVTAEGTLATVLASVSAPADGCR